MAQIRYPTLRSSGFTLIELLIVVAIIAILAAIAVPNFLEAQTRAKVSRAKADMRAMATATETYHIDYSKYMIDSSTRTDTPGYSHDAWGITSAEDYHKIRQYAPAARYDALFRLTSPISYMSSLPVQNPFGEYSSYDPTKKHVGYWYRGTPVWLRVERARSAPYAEEWYGTQYSFDCTGPSKKLYSNGKYLVYDPTNGTVSYGGIWYLYGPSSLHSFH